MIITRSWINEWIDLKGITTEELAKTLNAIGLEVDRVETYDIPPKIVVGKVLSCEKHPDADKLSVCQVDIGTGVRQIVCGASNVRADITVAVATVGAQMPGGLKIKPVKLRGVESEGMICSSTEIGLPKLEDGIMILDESYGKLPLGSELRESPLFTDDLIEIELTANRGDCLSIRGVARDLAAAFDRPVKQIEYNDDEEHRVGIGRILQLTHIDAEYVNLSYRAIDLRSLELPGLLSLRLAQIEEKKENALESLLFYATYNSGVVLRAYHFGFFAEDEGNKAKMTLKNDENGFAAIFGKEKASIVGVRQEDPSRVTYSEGTALIEASYIPPDIVSKQMAEHKIESGPLFYRTSRGSEPELDLGLKYCLGLIEHYSDSTVYGGSIDLGKHYEEKVVSITIDEINAIIGAVIDKTTITKLLKNLGFGLCKSQGDSFVVEVPQYRHDIVNKQDLVEEIVRIVGIDNIPSKPFVLAEANRLDDDYFTYKKRQTYRRRAAQSGFYETVHFVFNERAVLENLGFDGVAGAKELINPIAGTLDTLRPTLLVGLLDAASKNAKVGQKQIRLFESGSVFDTERNEHVRMGFIHSGAAEREGIANGGKPKNADFGEFTQKIADVIGDFSLVQVKPAHELAHPYQAASVVVDGETIGELFKLHPTLQKEFDLGDTFLCELDFDALPFGLKEAKPFSKFQASFRDLSLVMPSSMAYTMIENVINANKSAEVIRFYPVDRYQDASLGDDVSLTIRFVLQSMEKTLEEEDITSSMQSVLGALESELGLALR
jgi:phenylalanyl-tRNA synthetase beta chain